MRLVAVIGGSGSGKTWFADRLAASMDGRALRLSLDDFYRDCGSAGRNFDHPSAIDWPVLRQVLGRLRDGQTVAVPRYDFCTHRRRADWVLVAPRPWLVMDGLWLLWPEDLRACFEWRVYLECPQALRWRRRLARDLAQRGRSAAAVRRQFQDCVLPMHRRFVAPQLVWANRIVPAACQQQEVQRLGEVMARS